METGAGVTAEFAWTLGGASSGEARDEAGMDRTTPYPRPLAAMLADSHHRATAAMDGTIRSNPTKVAAAWASAPSEQENELEGCSSFVAIDHDVKAIIAQHKPSIRYLAQASSAAKGGREGAKERSQGAREKELSVGQVVLGADAQSVDRQMLEDLFCSGFTSHMATPTEHEPLLSNGGPSDTLILSRSQDNREPELEGSQTWTSLVPNKTITVNDQDPQIEGDGDPQELDRGRQDQIATLTFATHADPTREIQLVPGTDTPTLPLNYGGSVEPADRAGAASSESGDSSESALITTVQATTADMPAATAADWGISVAATDKQGIQSTASGAKEASEASAAVVATVNVREREEELKLALDRIVPRLLDRNQRVNYLETRLQAAMRGESGRNALIKQVATLENEVKHLRERLDMRQADTVKWRDERQDVEAENSRLNAELHRALDRCSRLDSDGRRKDTLLAEATASKHGLAEANASCEVELRHKDQLLVEAERERKRAFQTTNASAETARRAVRRAEAAEKEVEILRGQVRRWDDGNYVSNAEPGDRKNTSPSILPATTEDDGTSRANRRLTWGESRPPGLANDVMVELHRSRGRSCSPKRGGSSAAIQADARAYSSNNQASPDEDQRSYDLKAGDKTVDSASPTPPKPPPAEITPFEPSSFDRQNVDSLQGRGHRLSSASDGVRNALVLTQSERRKSPRAWRNSHDTPPNPAREQVGRGREHVRSGERERHDSAGVRGALTAARPEWASEIMVDNGVGTLQDAANMGWRDRGKFSTSSPETCWKVREGDSLNRRRSPAAGAYGRLSLNGRLGQGSRGMQVDRPAVQRSQHGISSDSEWNVNRRSPTPTRGLPSAVAGEVAFARSQVFAAAGQRRGRDWLSSRRSSLSGAAVDVQSEVKTEGRHSCSPSIGPEGPRSSPFLGEKHGTDGISDNSRLQYGSHAAQNDTIGVPSTADNVRGSNDSNCDKMNRNSCGSIGLGVEERRAAGLSSGSAEPTQLLADMIGEREMVGFSTDDEGDGYRRCRRAGAPFATDAIHEELGAQRELERKLMVLQMEASQLEAEQTRLLPRATKTMQARVRMKDIESRLDWLGKEASGLRRSIRAKVWRG